MLDEKRSELEKRKQELEQLEAVKKGAEERKAAAEAVEKAAKAVQDARWEETRKVKNCQTLYYFIKKKIPQICNNFSIFKNN